MGLPVARGGWRIAEWFLVRVFADLDQDPPEVVTVYRTSQIAKYWRGAP